MRVSDVCCTLKNCISPISPRYYTIRGRDIQPRIYPVTAAARDIQWLRIPRSNEAIYFFAARYEREARSVRVRRAVISICDGNFFSTSRRRRRRRRLTRGAPTTCRDTGSLLTSLTFPLILLEARHMYWPCCSYVTFVRINRCPVPHSNGIRPSVNTCAHLHTRGRTRIRTLKAFPLANTSRCRGVAQQREIQDKRNGKMVASVPLCGNVTVERDVESSHEYEGPVTERNRLHAQSHAEIDNIEHEDTIEMYRT